MDQNNKQNIANYTPIIGLEIHVELKTKSKMFCDCDAKHFRIKPNTHTCPVCLGLPGALPVPNKQAVHWCQLLGLALNCKIAKKSKFDRKNYFYPDLAKGYQISQHDQPLCFQGYYDLKKGKKISITRVHMEEDTGKNIHKNINGKKLTLIDFNRSGVPLVEIVTEPDFRSAKDVDIFLKDLRRIIRYLDISDADMEKGSMRLELNISLTKSQVFNTKSKINSKLKTQNKKINTKYKLPSYRVEVKNINSFRFVKKAIKYEIKRQADILDRYKVPAQETRGWQENVGKTISQRTKEEARDYRYFPEPDIPPMIFTTDHINRLKNILPELPQSKQTRFEKEYKLATETASFLIDTKELADYFEACVKENKVDPVRLANIIKNKKISWQKHTPNEFVKKIIKIKKSKISDRGQLEEIIKKIIKTNPNLVKKYQQGKNQLLGFFIGQVMQQTKGQADAKTVREILTNKLEALK